MSGSFETTAFDSGGFDTGSGSVTTLTCVPGNFPWTGNSSGLIFDGFIAGGGPFEVTGFDSGGFNTTETPVASYSFRLSDVSASLRYVQPFTLGYASFAWTGVAASLTLNARLVNAAAAYSWDGQPAVFRSSWALSSSIFASHDWPASLLATVGLGASNAGIAWTTKPATLLADGKINAATGSYVWSGLDAGFNSFACEKGVFAWSGLDAGVLRIAPQTCEPIAFEWNGYEADFPATHTGSGSGAVSKKRKYVVRKDGKLLVFKNEADALTVLSATQEPQEITASVVEKPKKKVIRQAEARAEEVLPIEQVEDLAQSRGEMEAVRQMLAQAQYAALMALVQRMQDEEDVEMLLLAA